MKTEVGSTSRPVSLNPSISKLFQTRGFRVPLMIHAWKVCMWREKTCPQPPTCKTARKIQDRYDRYSR